MRLKSLYLHRLPGFKLRGFSLAEGVIGAKINLVIGPNASGKTSICQAIQKLLWPEQFTLTPAWIESQWEWQGRPFAISIEGSQRLGGEGLRLPDAGLASCFSIAIDDLFAAEDSDFAKKISEAMSGGYSLERALSRIAPGAGAKGEVMEWRAAQQQLRRYELEPRALRHREELIPRLEAELQEALRCERGAALAALTAQLRQVEEQAAPWRSLSLPTDLEQQHARLDQICALESQHQQLREEIQQKEVAMAARSQLLGLSTEAVAALRVEELWPLQQLWQSREEAKSRAAGIAEQLQALPQPQESDARKISQAIELLNQLLAQRSLLLPVGLLLIVALLFRQLWAPLLILPTLWREMQLRARYKAMSWPKPLLWSRAQISQRLQELLDTWGAAQQAAAAAQQQRILSQTLAALQQTIAEQSAQLERSGIAQSLILFIPELRDLHNEWVALEQMRHRFATLEARLTQERTLWSQFATPWGEAKPIRGAFERILARVESVRSFQRKERELAALREQVGDLPDDAPERAARVEELRKELAELQAEIRHAERAGTGQQLREILRERLSAVQSAARLVVRKELTQFLVDRVEQIYRRDHQPAVVQRAARWFQQITNNQFLLAAEGSSFEAIESSTQERKSIAQLSRGTRMQLLLAVRLAFALEQEPEGVRMPLFLDEVLTNSDPERFDHVVQLLSQLAQEGRQIFYFTCNPDDVWRWQSICPDIAIIDLRQIQQQQAFLSAPLLSPKTLKRPQPLPDQTLDDYAQQQQLPSLRTEEPTEMVSIYYLANHPEELYHLLNGGVTTYGQWKQVDPKSWATLVQPDTIARRGQILERYLSLKKQGRGRPLTKEALSEGASAAFVERLWDAVKECDYDARRFLALLEAREDERVKRFQKKSIELLRDHLVHTGFFDERETLDPDAIQRQLFPFAAQLLGPEEAHNYLERLRR